MPESRLMSAKADDNLDREDIWKAFDEAVNMTPAALEKWLATKDSQAVGWKDTDGKESIGHESGRRIVAIKRTKKADLNDADYRHMRKVVGYVHRHLAQGGPDKEKAHSPWRYSLMNWGHDPLRGKGAGELAMIRRRGAAALKADATAETFL